MPNFSNLRLIEKYIEIKVESAMRDEVSKKGTEVLKRSLKENVYKEKPKSYERTMELYNSVFSNTQRSSSVVSTEIYNNTDLINPYQNTGQHTSWVNNSDQSENIPAWMEFGNYSGDNNPIYKHEPTHFVKKARSKLVNNKQHLYALSDGLRSRGLRVELNKKL